MRRRRWTTIIVAVLVVLGAAPFALEAAIERRMRGPAAPRCEHLPVERAGFERPVQLSSRQTPGARLYDIEPSAAVLRDGTLAVVFNPRDSFFSGTSGLVTAAISLDGGVELRPYPTGRAESFDAWMAVGADGVARMVWLAHDGSSPEKHMAVELAESADGRAWSAPRAVHAKRDCPPEERGCLDKPMIAALPDAMAIAYFSELVDGERAVRLELDGGLAAQSVPLPGGAYGDLAVAGGALWAALIAGEAEDADRFGDVRNSIILTRSDDGARSFSDALTVSAAGESIPFLFSNPQVVADERRGFLYVAYPAGPPLRWDIQLATSADQGKTWKRVRVNDEDSSCATHMTPHAALDPATGTLHLTWLENRGGTGALVHATCEPGGARCSANDQVSDAPFASFGFERHLPAWLSEYGALVVDDERRWLHAVWTQPVLEDGAPRSRIFWSRLRLPAPREP